MMGLRIQSKNNNFIQIRPATTADASAIAIVNVETWRNNYKGILPDDFLKNMSYQKNSIGHTRMISTGFIVRVAEKDGKIRAFATANIIKNSTKIEKQAEILMIYVDKEFQGIGIGKKLFESIKKEISDRGYKSIIAWTFIDGNSSKFYKSLDGKECGSKFMNIGGKEIETVCFKYNL